MTWSNGRQLDSTNVGGMNLSYSYNADGQRTSKSRSAYYTDEYVYYGTQLSTLIRNGVGYKHSLTFIYDDNGQALGFYYDTNLNDSNPGTKYYYVCNAQGDVLQLRDHTNAPVANYYYDAWGKLLGITDANGNAITAFNSVAVLNPIRYRGYFYDTETGFYYLNSRYYDPEIGRFINADNQLIIGSDMTSMNLFAYCGNNPVNRIDPTGEAWWHWALGAVVVVTCAVATVVTAGGFAAAAGAVAAVGSGVAAATTASTVAAGAFIGSATVYGMAVVSAASTSSTPQEFADQGNWGTVAATAGGAVWGGASGYAMSKAQTPTTTGRGTQNPKVKAAVQKGQAMHKQMDYGPGVLKEKTIAPGCRVDGIDFNNRIIYELKPNNPQAIARGISQLNRYTKAASQQYGGEWMGVLKLYDD